MDKGKRCSLCKFGTFEENFGEFICHNEESDYYGKILNDYRNTVCDDYNAYNLKMSLTEALEVLTAFTNITDVSYKLPNGDDKAYLTLSFDTNNDLEKYREALMIIFKEVL